MKTALQDKQLRRDVNLIDLILASVIALLCLALELLGYMSGGVVL